MQIEILLMTKVFTSRQFCETKGRFINNLQAKKEKLLEAYNSLLLSLMPEISERDSGNKKLYICKMTDNSLLLELEFGKINRKGELRYSIDPCSFMPEKILS